MYIHICMYICSECIPCKKAEVALCGPSHTCTCNVYHSTCMYVCIHVWGWLWYVLVPITVLVQCGACDVDAVYSLFLTLVPFSDGTGKDNGSQTDESPSHGQCSTTAGNIECVFVFQTQSASTMSRVIDHRTKEIARREGHRKYTRMQLENCVVYS